MNVRMGSKIGPEVHHLASQGLLIDDNGDHEECNVLSHPYTNSGLFFLLTIKYRILCLKSLSEVPEYAEM